MTRSPALKASPSVLENIMTKASPIRSAVSHALALTMMVGIFTVANMAIPVAASAQSSTDACPGAAGAAQTYAFDGIPTTSDELLPSVRRSISILGIRADRSDCALRITCVSPSNDRDERRTRDRQCSVTRSAIFAYERRANVRDRLREELDIVKLTGPSGGFSAGRVYVTLIAK